MKLEIHERNQLLNVVKTFGTKDKLTLSQSDSLIDVLDIIKRDIKSSAHRVDEKFEISEDDL